MQYTLFKIKKNKFPQWQKWSRFLIKNKKEVLMTLEEENIYLEGCFYVEIEKNIYVCLYGINQKNKKIKKANLQKEINIKHREKMKECFEERVKKTKNLYFFQQD